MIDPKTIWNSPDLPTLPTVAVRLLEISKDPDVEVAEMASLLKTDPAITARILRGVNSSCFGLRSQVVAIERAIPLLGTKRIATLALSLSLAQQAVTSGPMRDHYKAYWLQSVVQAAAAEILAERYLKTMEAEFFLSGLMTDIGRLAMLKAIPDAYLPVLEATRDAHIELQVVERTVLGFDHIDIGTRLQESWNLPGALIQATRHHHMNSTALSSLRNDSGKELTKAIAISAAAGDCYCTSSVGDATTRCQRLGQTIYGWSNSDFESYLETIQNRLAPMGDLFEIDTADLPDASEILEAAAEQLVMLTDRDNPGHD